jgi:hypothetical protein
VELPLALRRGVPLGISLRFGGDVYAGYFAAAVRGKERFRAQDWFPVVQRVLRRRRG